ncbi:hypothetical protein [Streptomyces sp. NRRL S-87]|uniref:hypothetical protein n=1 Tax=Streptomyces sp. NRRL S-87 TaxID=1463920 RepID=UPI000689A649|nr:hypothetical protein [Streptomyces sp. NRRL S-87]
MRVSRFLKEWRTRLLAAGAALTMAGGAVVLAPGVAQAAPARGLAYVWANSPNSALNVPYTPSAFYSRNSTGGTNTVVRTGTGQYTVRMPGLGLIGGTVHVTAYGSTSHTCGVNYWVPGAGGRLDVHVSCFTRTGARVNTTFDASFVNTAVVGGSRIAYVWANQPTSAAYTPSTSYQFNSGGSTNTITRQGAGQYRVRVPSIGAAAGHVQVTAYGDVAARCKVVNWFPSGSTEYVNVRCHNAVGRLADNRFTLTYVRSTGILRTTPAAYAWANQPTTAAYNPAASYAYNSTGSVMRIRRIGTGTYRFVPPNMPLGNGHVQVTAYGSDSAYCKVDFWTPSTGVQIRCFAPSGALVDTYYDVAFQR